ncbi:MAG TPA: hypothetical protein DD737_06675 [Ruminococcaceae bacterium]|jgi:hypothetical protein|nr:hypothetical protein [Oscillospiraceae bacterium]
MGGAFAPPQLIEKQTDRRKIVQDKATSAANEGAYSLYVTEICKRSPLGSKIAMQFCGCATFSMA